MLRIVLSVIAPHRCVRSISAEKPPVTKKGKEHTVEDTTPSRKLDDLEPYDDPNLKKHPRGVNPITGEVGGPSGPEPTRYGDWERKGRVSDF